MDFYHNDHTPERDEYNPQPENVQPQHETEQPQYGEQNTPYQTPVRSSEESGRAENEQQTMNQTPFSQQPASSYTTYQEWQKQEEEKQHRARQEKQNKKPHGRKIWIGVGAAAAAVLLFVAGVAAGGGFSDRNAPAQSAGTSQQFNPDLPSLDIHQSPKGDKVSTAKKPALSGGIMTGEEIYKKLNESIVAIQVASLQSGSGGSGSGVIMSEDGYIITNAHVVTDEQTNAPVDKVTVQLSDGNQLPAKIIGVDVQTDLAVIKVVPETPLKAAEFGDSDMLEVGETAYAIGSPGGLELANSMTSGIISAINRDITVNDRVMSFIQTNVTINPGNSGGAFINQYGQVVGVTSAKLGISYYEGLGFAIPINSAKEIVDQLIQNGYVAGRPSIGIRGQNLSEQTAAFNDVPQGVLVASVDSRAHAAQEGLEPKDIIIGVDGKEVKTMDEINAVKGDKKAGDKIKLTVYRMSEGKKLDVTVTLTDAHDLEGQDPALMPRNDSTQKPQGGQRPFDPFSYFFGY